MGGGLMRKIILFKIIFLSLCLQCFAQNQSLPIKGVVTHRQKAGNPDARGWSEAKSTLGGYVVLLPGFFTDLSIFDVNPSGQAVSVHIVSTLKEAKVKFLANCTQYPEGVLLEQANLDEFVKKMGQAMTINSQRPISYLGYPGYELSVTSKTSKGIVRAYVIKNKLYQLVVNLNLEIEVNFEEDAKYFFSSFKILE